MLRKDEIDPGCWFGQAPTCALIMPLDTHINRFGRELGLTMRKNADLKAAMEITDSLLAYCPQDPVKYDFSLTRAAYHNGGRLD